MAIQVLITNKGLDFYEVSSAFQKCVRRGLEDEAMYWAVELHESGFGDYLWKRMKVIASEDVGLAEPLMVLQVKALWENWKEQRKDDKVTQKTSHRLFVTQAVLLLCRAKKSRLIDHFNIYHFRSHSTTNLEIPDFAFDKHTRRGKRIGRGIDHFFAEGAKLENLGDVDREAEFEAKAKEILKNPPTSQEPPKDGEQSKLF
jgi:replication-associated recombination protein RarA